MKKHLAIYGAIFLMISSCNESKLADEGSGADSKAETVIKRREDGTVSSVNQVNANNRVHGIRATYYKDGRTLYSKHTFQHGVKQGPATWYYTNGRVFKQTNFEDGKRHGLTRIYYKDGSLSAEFESENGNVQPGLKEYKKDGSLVTAYPEIQFREINHLASRNRLDLEVSCTKKKNIPDNRKVYSTSAVLCEPRRGTKSKC